MEFIITTTIIAALLTIGYYVFVEETSWLQAVKNTGGVAGTIAGHTPETIKVSTKYLKTNHAEYKLNMEKTGSTYHEGFKDSYKTARVASKVFFKETNADLDKRFTSATNELNDLMK